MRFLAKQVNTLGGSIAVGSGSKTPAVSDLHLTYEFDRATIYLSSLDSLTKRIVFKGTIDTNTVGSIYEVGLYSTPFGSFAAGSPSRTLATFERDTESWSSGSWLSTNNRIGIEGLRLSANAGLTTTSALSSVALDLSGYGNSDEITLAFFANANTATVRVRFRGVDPNTYFEASTTPVSGYNVVSFKKNTLTKTGVLDWAGIDSVELSITAKAGGGTSSVDFDGIRIETASPDIDNVLISRSVLATPVVKTSIAEMDIEYALEVSL